MWMQQFGEQMRPVIRHWCDQNDGLPMYGWVVHDGANFGLHELLDQFYTISADFVKRPGGSHGGDWSARIRVNPRVCILYYVIFKKFLNFSVWFLERR